MAAKGASPVRGAARCVLGVDPGLTRCGIGVVSGPASRPSLVHRQVVRTAPDTPLEQRLLAVHDAILTAIDAHTPDAVAVEQVLFSSNVRSAMATGQAAGAALLAAARTGMPVVSYSPTDVKLTVAGSGTADKDAVMRLVAAQLRLDTLPRPADVADALAVALTHLARSRVEAATAGTPAASALADARRAADRASRSGWAGVLADRGVVVPPASPRPSAGGRRR